MSEIAFSKEEREEIVAAIQIYLRDELELDASAFDVGFLLDFFTEKIGGAYYNRGLYDAQALLSKRMDDIGEAIVGLEKPVDFRK